MAEPFSLYKLMILYMLHKVDFPLSNVQLSDFILGEGYTTYFKFQESIHDLLEDRMIRDELEHGRTLYHLTPSGEETLGFFEKNISPAIVEEMDLYFEKNRYDLKNETAVKADYYVNKNHEYSVHCQVLESGLPLIELTVSVPTEEEASSVVAKWRERNQEIYAAIMAKLL